MSDTRYIKAAAFGGYDKADVDKRIDGLNNLVYDLKNELREIKLVVKKYEEGSDAQKAYETTLSNERAQLTHLQVKNSNLSEKNKAISEELKDKEQEIADLRAKTDALEAENAQLKIDLQAAKNDNIAEGMSIIFAEAQKSHDRIINEAKAEAEEKEAGCRKFVEEYIADANNKAAKIIYDAEREAAEVIAEAKNSSEKMKVASDNLKVVVLDDVQKLSDELDRVKALLADLSEKSGKIIADTESVLDHTRDEINKGGVPVFKAPENYAPEYPEEPEYQVPAAAAEEEEQKQKRNAELEKLQAMANAIGGKNNADKSKSINLSDLAAQAAAIGGGAPVNSDEAPAEKTEEKPAEAPKAEEKPAEKPAAEEKPAEEPKAEEKPAPKKGGIGLSDLMKMANDLDK